MNKYRLYAFISLILITCGVAGIASFNIAVDPYWLWQRNAEQERTHLVLSRKLRFIKPLQVLITQPEVVLLGSSRVYRGFEPNKLDFYNFGMSSLRISEARDFADYATRWTPVKHLIIGLDFFMFDGRSKGHAVFASDPKRFDYPIRAISASLLSVTALEDSWGIYSKKTADSDTRWTPAGFSHTPPTSGKGVLRRADKLRRKYYAGHTITEETYQTLEEIIATARDRKVKIDLYISPINQVLFDQLEQEHLTNKYNSWRDRIKSVACQNNIPLWDFGNKNSVTMSNMANGSSEYFIDASHFTPLVGDMILSRVGFANRHDLNIPEDFGLPAHEQCQILKTARLSRNNRR